MIQVLDVSRWRGVIELFVSFPIETDRSHVHQQPRCTADGGAARQTPLHLSGCSTILGCPLPNHGNYDSCPIEIITTALAHIAHLTDAISTVLNIPVVNPINAFDTFECTISPHGNQG
jgi:hypothetical protein